MVLSLLKNGDVWEPEHLNNKLSYKGSLEHQPVYVRPLGLKPCKKNPRDKYHVYDLVI